jgi:hypothetical protein
MINFSATAPARKWLVPVFFAMVLALGLSVFRDYGISIDEKQSRSNGMTTLKHVGRMVAPAWVAADHNFKEFTTPLPEYNDRDYGVVFETPVSLLERLLGLQDGRDKYLLRHLCTFLVCFGGIVALYQLAARRYADWRMGLLAATWLLLSPRLFAESFYNDKDAVFMAMFAIATNASISLLLRPTMSRALVAALAGAATIDIRIVGVVLPGATLAMLVWRGLRAEVRWPRMGSVAAVYIGAIGVLVVALWPYLWPAPLANFASAFQRMSAFRWGGTVLYLGEFVPAAEVPWHYTLVWLGITTPLLYVGGGILGIGLVLRDVVHHRWRLWHNEQGMQDFFFLGLFVGPLLAVIAMHSVLYDGWRQVYFVYPAFLLLALRGWWELASWRSRWASWPKLVYIISALSLGITAAQIVRDHPLQNLYFNALAGPDIEHRFDMDYWGVGFRKDLEYILDHEMRPVIYVYTPTPDYYINLAEVNLQMIPAFQRDRIRVVDRPELADYFITNYRWHPEDYPYENEVYQLRVDGNRVHSIFQLH